MVSSRLHNFILVFVYNSQDKPSVCKMKAANSASVGHMVPSIWDTSLTYKPSLAHPSNATYLHNAFALASQQKRIYSAFSEFPLSTSCKINLVLSIPFYLYYSWFCSFFILNAEMGDMLHSLLLWYLSWYTTTLNKRAGLSKTISSPNGRKNTYFTRLLHISLR